ncbi:hypothetical protein CAI21_09000 [Alkalilimnicola ehrlichii]|uniref:Sensor protein n=1 Tax=Alkalilimnicola ehrlichii TaxID=351052 RepID=A0A3E0WWZ6_9GAMM|nr:type IV pili methyl-accepting chemotaxis transducer N-terminal domain-containing protein [Alkalilimnicola ehrlichii]RFA29947.1 hypothetical protein CAI21_09000 [Alkalilimnicola ehrlichii]RFA36536.1 hypothetical protein CAL65_11270 [Alkalilimnicola ehrlichii]
MQNSITQSLIFRAGVTMGGIVILALTSMLGSIIIAETARDDAAAINHAGSLRMQSYRIAARLPDAEPQQIEQYAEQFEATLDSPAIRGLVPASQRHDVNASYERLRKRWEEELRPLASLAATGSTAAISAYNEGVSDFATEVDGFVTLLQREAEARLQLLRLIQGATLFMTLALVFLAMYKLVTDVVPPLRALFQVVNQVRRADFSGRTTYEGGDELGLLSRTINQMNDSLSRMYAELEQRVEDKTAALKRSNESLRLMYQAARQLNGEPASSHTYRSVLEQMEQVTGLGPITLCLSHEEADRAYQRISTLNERQPGFCQAPECGDCFQGIRGRMHVRTVPVGESDHRYGVLLVQYPPDRQPQRWQLELVETVAGHIATALTLSRRHEEQRRLALMDERAVIARELHDSLAQALSYLKIQVTRLQTLIRNQAPAEDKQAVIDELREGLNSAYRQLRELLTTFRLKMDQPGLEPALQGTVREFSKRGELEIQLEYDLKHCPLTPNEEIHTLQVVREALANVVHHARARTCDVQLHTDAHGRVVVRVSDDGVGLPEDWQRRTNHYGSTIMQERADGLGGTLSLARRQEGGTEVKLTFTPAASEEDTTTLLTGN